MMDSRTADVLRRIGGSIPKRLMRQAVDKTTDRDGARMAERIVADKNVSPEVRAAMLRNLESGQYDKVRETVNQKGAKEIDRYIEAKVQQAIAHGDIPKASESDYRRVAGRR